MSSPLPPVGQQPQALARRGLRVLRPVQFPDGEIYVVTYIVGDAPNGQIRGYAFEESDFVLPD